MTARPVRDERLTTRFTRGEREELERRAQEAGMSPSTFLRQCALDEAPRRRRVRHRDAALHNLPRLARRLDRLSAKAMAGGRFAEASELGAVAEAAQRVFEELTS